MKRIHHTLGWGLIFALLLGAVSAVSLGTVDAQEAINVVDQSVATSFRDHLTFRLNAESSSEIVEVTLFYQVVGQVATSRNSAEFTPGTSVEAEFVIDQTNPANYLPPGTEMEYWWEVVDAEGNELETERETLLYLDDRYDWQTLENERLTLYWYEGGDEFGQALFDRANLALDTLETDVGVTIENPIKIFIYANHSDLLGAISTSAQEWTGGQAFTRYGVVLIGIAPTQLEWGLNAMTHEMTHLVIHQATENPFGDLPRWLDEGIAVYNENQDELDDDFRPIFERAVQNDELMTLRSLSSPFPADPLEANLAYGQSGAMVKFMIDHYGSDKMSELLTIFSEGALYDEALEQALGIDTDGLDNEFRASLELPPLPGTEAGAEAEDTTSAEPAQEMNIAEEAEEEQTSAEDAAVDEASGQNSTQESSGEEAEAPAQPASEDSEGSSIPISLPCLTGLIFLLTLGVARLVFNRSG